MNLENLEIQNNKKLIKWIYFIPIFAIVIVVVLIASIFILKEKTIYKDSVRAYKTKLLKIKKIDIEDRIKKLSNQIEINKDVIIQESKNNVKNMVEFAYKIIQKIYENNKDKDKKIIIKKITDKLRDMRFFNNLSGYFYMYYLDGTCILLPVNPNLEGRNLINITDAKGTRIIQEAINILKNKNSAFSSWYWYKPGNKDMKKKIGYFKVFKPLNIYVGSAFYVEDVLNKAKKIALKIIKNYRYDDGNYIFIYNDKGVVIYDINKSLIGKNLFNKEVNKIHIVREIIKGSKINKDGFFISYINILKNGKNSKKVLYIKYLPEFKWIIGTGFYIEDIKKASKEKYLFLSKEFKNTIKYIIAISLLIIILLSIIMIFVANNIKNIFFKYEENLLRQYKETEVQRKIFRLLFEKSKDAIFLTRKDNIIDCNDSALELFRIKQKKDLLNKTPFELSPKYQPDGELSHKKIVKIMKTAVEKGVYRGEWLSLRNDSTTCWLDLSITTIFMENKIIFHVIARDINKRKRIEKELKENEKKLSFKARHDDLTMLPNRFMYNEIILHETLKAKREKKKIAFMFVDLDGFKDINDYYGHDMGDELLKKTAKRLKEEIRESDYLFRFGGDEFVLLFSEFNDENDIAIIAQKIINTFSNPFDIRGQIIKIGVSIGIAIYPQDAINRDELLRNADIAMYRAKEEGKNRYVFFEENMYKKIIQRHTIEDNLKKAIINDEFVLFYQPQIDVFKKRVIGLEALIRWQKDGKIIPPNEFIHIAEASSLINDIGNIVIRKSIEFSKKLQELGLSVEKISINLADSQLKNINLVSTIEDVLKSYNCKGEYIEFEITEGFIMSDLQNSYILLRKLRDLGCSVAIDDFGTGYSSLAYLKKLPLDVIKIDQSFIRDIPGFSEDEAIVKAIIELGKGLRLKIIAEGIENIDQENFLKSQGCDIIQGYLYSKPLCEKKVISFIRSFK